MNPSDTEINIYYATDKKYFEQCVISLMSVLFNHKSPEKLCFHILNPDLDENDLKIIDSLKSGYDFGFDSVKINASDFDNYSNKINMGHLSIVTYYRFKIPEISDADKVIYLDCDLVAEDDISKLYNVDITGYKAGVVEDKIISNGENPITSGKYFNAGVLLLNLKEIRKTNLFEDAAKYYAENKEKIKFHDQDVLNGLWENTVIFLDEKYNAQHCSFMPLRKRYSDAGIKKIENPVIIHYTGSEKPWDLLCRHSKANLWLKYKQMSPFKYSLLQLSLFKTKKIFSKIFYIEKNKDNFGRKSVRFLGIKIKLGKKKI